MYMQVKGLREFDICKVIEEVGMFVIVMLLLVFFFWVVRINVSMMLFVIVLCLDYYLLCICLWCGKEEIYEYVEEDVVLGIDGKGSDWVV